MKSTISQLINKGDNRTAKIKKNIIGSVLIKAVSILTSLCIVPLTLGYISDELYGIWLTLSSITIWINFFDIGFTQGLKNKLTEAIALNQIEKGKSLVSTTYIIVTTIFIPIAFFSIFIIPHINWSTFLNVDAKYTNTIISTMYVLIISFCLQMIINIISTVAAAYQKVAYASLFTTIGQIFSLIGVYLLKIFFPPSLTYLALALTTPQIISLAFFSYILFKKEFKPISPNYKSYDSKYIKEIFSLGLKFFLIQIQFVILYQTTNILISKISSPIDVTNYNIAYKYLSVAMMLYTIILSPLWPAFTDAYSKHDFTWMRNIYKKMTYIYFISITVIILMAFFSPMAYKLWLGEKITVPFSMTFCVAMYLIINSWDSLQVQMINGCGCVKLQTYITIIGLVFHIPISFFLGKYIGAKGVILSMMIINIIYATFFTIQINLIIRNKAKGIWKK